MIQGIPLCRLFMRPPGGMAPKEACAVPRVCRMANLNARANTCMEPLRSLSLCIPSSFQNAAGPWGWQRLLSASAVAPRLRRGDPDAMRGAPRARRIVVCVYASKETSQAIANLESAPLRPHDRHVEISLDDRPGRTPSAGSRGVAKVSVTNSASAPPSPSFISLARALRTLAHVPNLRVWQPELDLSHGRPAVHRSQSFRCYSNSSPVYSTPRQLPGLLLLSWAFPGRI